MKYGYFDEEKREYVITRPDTPAPWTNYLGSPDMVLLFQTMPAATALKRVARMGGFCVTSLINLINRVDTFI